MPVYRRTAVISGAPGAGKTALLDVLARRGWRTVPEAARAILREPGGMTVRSSDPLGFAREMIRREAAQLKSTPDDGHWTIFDRGIADSLGFLNLSDLTIPPDIAELSRSERYSGPVFFASAWATIYRADLERTQNWDEAVASGEAVKAAWLEAGYSLEELPLGSIEARADFVETRLSRV